MRRHRSPCPCPTRSAEWSGARSLTRGARVQSMTAEAFLRSVQLCHPGMVTSTSGYPQQLPAIGRWQKGSSERATHTPTYGGPHTLCVACAGRERTSSACREPLQRHDLPRAVARRLAGGLRRWSPARAVPRRVVLGGDAEPLRSGGALLLDEPEAALSAQNCSRACGAFTSSFSEARSSSSLHIRQSFSPTPRPRATAAPSKGSSKSPTKMPNRLPDAELPCGRERFLARLLPN